MRTLYLMRHGYTLFNFLDKKQGWCDSPLTSVGVAQAREAGDHLRELGDLPHPTGVCIWDAAFSGEGWLTPEVWSSLAVLQAREAKLAR